MRSGTGRRWRRATSGCFCHGRSSCRLKLEGRLLRAMWRMSRNPSVVIMPQRAPVVLHHDVGGDGGSVHEVVDGIERDARRLHELTQTLHRGPRGVVGDRGHLVDADVPRFLVDQHEIGVGAPDVCSDTETGLGRFMFIIVFHKVMTHIRNRRFCADLHRHADPESGRIAFRDRSAAPCDSAHHPEPTHAAPRAMRCPVLTRHRVGRPQRPAASIRRGRPNLATGSSTVTFARLPPALARVPSHQARIPSGPRRSPDPLTRDVGFGSRN